MKVAILAGGRGRRLGAAAGDPPKPLVEIGGRPLLWHVMQRFAAFGHRHFVVALGHRAPEIVAWARAAWPGTAGAAAPWRIDLVDTGARAPTATRLARLRPHVDGEPFLLAWADGLADLDLAAMVAFHRSHGRLATVAAVHPPARYGHLELSGDRVARFEEKPRGREGWVSGGFFVLEPGVLDVAGAHAGAWERGPLAALAGAGELMAYRHRGFWCGLDTAADLAWLRRCWREGRAPWCAPAGERAGAARAAEAGR